jgi:hypothetical protein
MACRAPNATPLLLSGLLAVPGRGSVCAQSSPANRPAIFYTGVGHRPGQGQPLTAAIPGHSLGHIKGVIPSHQQCTTKPDKENRDR